MQYFWVAHHGISHKSLVFSQYTHELLGMCENQENRSDIPRERIAWTILYHAIENTVANIIKATYMRRMMGRLDVISSKLIYNGFPRPVIGSIFYGMIY